MSLGLRATCFILPLDFGCGHEKGTDPIIHYTICGAVCFQFTHFPCDDWEIYALSYYHYQIRSMNYYPLFRVRSWNNGVSCMSFYVLMGQPADAAELQFVQEALMGHLVECLTEIHDCHSQLHMHPHNYIYNNFMTWYQLLIPLIMRYNCQ